MVIFSLLEEKPSVGGPVCRATTLCTAEAKYMALAEAGKEAVWIKKLMNEMGFHQGANEVFYDSQSAIALSKNAVFHERTKHIARKYHFIET